jgi:hypothetical protein
MGTNVVGKKEKRPRSRRRMRMRMRIEFEGTERLKGSRESSQAFLCTKCFSNPPFALLASTCSFTYQINSDQPFPPFRRSYLRSDQINGFVIGQAPKRFRNALSSRRWGLRGCPEPLRGAPPSKSGLRPEVKHRKPTVPQPDSPIQLVRPGTSARQPPRRPSKFQNTPPVRLTRHESRARGVGG